MSKFSGKCDFYDDIEIFGLDYILNSNVYVGNSEEPLELNCYEDCIPYFPYIVCMGGYDKNKASIRLSSESWVDMEAEDFRKSGFSSNMHRFYKEELQEEIEKYKRGDA